MKILAMFTGQGSQYAGMGKSLLDDFPYCREVFEQIEDEMQLRVRHLCFNADDKTLMQTVNTQPCLFAVSIAYYTVLRQESEHLPAVFAGHSLGEISALVASGKLALPSACRLVKLRGKVMQEMVRHGGMVAVIRSQLQIVEQAVQQANEQTGEIIDLANFNSPKQVVLAGSVAGIQAVCELLTAAKCRWVQVPVSAPFHSRLMQRAQEQMTKPIATSKFINNDAIVISNYHGDIRPYQSEFLLKQISNAVQWTKTIETALAYGCDTCIEVGSKKVLTSLLRAFPTWKGKAFPLETNLREFISQKY